MSAAPPARLAFFKLNVENMAAALAFWRTAFGFEVVTSFDLPDFLEHILAIPGADRAAPKLMLVEHRPARAVVMGSGHGPVGLVCPDVAASHAQALAAGASTLMPPADVGGGVIVALLASPQGHTIELVQLPGYTNAR